MKRFILILTFLVIAPFAFAANVCVGPSSSGDGSGDDWSNIAQWSSVTFTRGNTYYLQDGTYGSKTLSTAASGSTYIEIKKATESAHGTDTGWQTTYGDGTATFSGGASLTITTNYWDISGVSGGGPGSWTTGHGIVFTSAAGTSVNYITISSGVSYIFIRHIYFNQVGDTTAYSTRAHGIYNTGYLNNTTFEYNYSDNLGGTPWLLRLGTGLIFQYNYTGDICGMSEYNPNDHCETLVMYGLIDVHFRWNYVAECPSTGGFVKNDVDTSTDIRIYGNVFRDGKPIVANTGTCNDWLIFNNTFIDASSGPITGDCSSSGFVIYNNIVFSSDATTTWGTHDYNWFTQIPTNSCDMDLSSNENCIDNYPSLCDDCTETADPFTNSSGTTMEAFSLSGAISGGAGYNVCLLDACTGEKKYNIDALNETRGLDGTWDRGALEYGEGSSQPIRGVNIGSGL